MTHISTFNKACNERCLFVTRSAPAGYRRLQRGFTLIELIVVVVILGFLAAVAIPKMANLQQASRVAVLNGVAGAISTAAGLGRTLCGKTATCSMSAPNSANSTFSFNGVNVYTNYGWPSGWGKFGVNDGVGSVVDMLNISSDIQLVAHIPGSFAGVFALSKASDPANCKVTYQLSGVDDSMSVNVESSGC